jgi:hypothetical protein
MFVECSDARAVLKPPQAQIGPLPYAFVSRSKLSRLIEPLRGSTELARKCDTGCRTGLLRWRRSAGPAQSAIRRPGLPRPPRCCGRGCPEPVRDGLIARLAFREAAGWLATLGWWVHAPPT